MLERTLTQADFDRFAALSGDDNPIHVDAAFSAAPRFERPVAHGMLLYTILRGLLDELAPGSRQANQQLKFPAQTYAGEALRFEVTLVDNDDEQLHAMTRCTRIADGAVTCSTESTIPSGGDGRRSIRSCCWMAR